MSCGRGFSACLLRRSCTASWSAHVQIATPLRWTSHVPLAARHKPTFHSAGNRSSMSLADTQRPRCRRTLSDRAERGVSHSSRRTRQSRTGKEGTLHERCGSGTYRQDSTCRRAGAGRPARDTSDARRGAKPSSTMASPLSQGTLNVLLQLSDQLFDCEIEDSMGARGSECDRDGALCSGAADEANRVPMRVSVASPTHDCGAVDSLQNRCSTSDVMDLLLMPESWQSSSPSQTGPSTVARVSRTGDEAAEPTRTTRCSEEQTHSCLALSPRTEDNLRSLLTLTTSSHVTHTHLREAVRLLLRGLVWRRVMGTNATLAECHVADKAMEQCDFTQMMWRRVRARRCSFERSVFYAVTMQDCVFEDCDFTGCVLSHVRCLGRVRFVRCNFSKAQLHLQTCLSGNSSAAGVDRSSSSVQDEAEARRHTQTACHARRHARESASNSLAGELPVVFDMCDFDLAEFSRDGASSLRHPHCFRRCRNIHLAANFPLRVVSDM